MKNDDFIRVGVDLGGTKIEISVLGEQGECLARERRSTPSGNYDAILRCVAELVKAMDEKFAGENQYCKYIGIATPGALQDGVIKNSNSTCLNGRSFKVDIETALNRPVRMSNDANCFALSEAIDGAASGADSVFGVIIGTGTGSGLVIHQKLLSGCNSIAGEWGHNPLPWRTDADNPSYACYCGQSGCIETYLSGPGFARRYNEVAHTDCSAEQIVQLAQDGTKLAQIHLMTYQHRLAKSLASVINIFDPDVIVLGGGMSNIESLYQTVPTLWNEYVFSNSVHTQLLAPKFGDASGVRGAAWLWPHDDSLF